MIRICELCFKSILRGLFEFSVKTSRFIRFLLPYLAIDNFTTKYTLILSFFYSVLECVPTSYQCKVLVRPKRLLYVCKMFNTMVKVPPKTLNSATTEKNLFQEKLEITSNVVVVI